MADNIPNFDDTEEVQDIPSFDDTEPVSFDDTVPMGGEMGMSEVVGQEMESLPSDEELKPKPEVSAGEAASLGAQQGLTFGFSDEMGAGIQSGADRLQRLLNEYTGLVGKSPSQVSEGLAEEGFAGDLGPTSSDEMYDEAIAENRQELQAAEEQQPVAYHGADVAAGFLGPAGAIKAAGKMKKVPELFKKFKQLSKVKQGAAAGAGTGALEAAGRTEEDLTSMEGMKDILQGTVLGGGLGAAGGKISQKMEKGNLLKKSDELMEEADEAALRSVGATDKQISESIESAEKFGTPKGSGIQAIEEGIVDPLSRPKETYRKALAVKNEIKKGYDDVIDSFDNQINLSEGQAGDLAQKWHQEVVEEVNKTLRTSSDELTGEAANKLGKDLDGLQDEILEALDSSNPIKKLQETYVKYNDAYFSNIASPTNNARKAMRNKIKEIQRNLADTVDSGTKNQFNELDKRYTNILDLEQMTLKGAAKKQTIGMGDVIKGATARLTGIPLAGELVTGASVASKKLIGKDLSDLMGGAGAIKKLKKAKKLQEAAKDPSKLRQTIEKSPAATGAAATTTATAFGGSLTSDDQVIEPYKLHQKTAKMAERATPEMITQQAQSIREEYGEEGERLASMLDNMSKKDTRGRRAYMFHILQNPQYKKMLTPKPTEEVEEE